MDIARISALLAPFLRGPIAVPGDSSPAVTGPCHPDAAKAGDVSAVLSPAQLQHISTYIDILLRWNARINLTAIRDPEEIVSRHFGESLFAARHLFPAFSPMALPSSAVNPFGGAGTLADLGSGAGFPGLPIKLWA